MNFSTIQPLLPKDQALHNKAGAIIARAQKLGHSVNPLTVNAISRLVRTVNCYYSNLIEGHDTHPVDIERAMQQEFSNDEGKRNLQLEAMAHLRVQEAMEQRLRDEPALNVCSEEFLCWLHKEFYNELPEAFRFVEDPQRTRREPIVPGALRTFDVSVGRHVAPPHDAIGELLNKTAQFYDPTRYTGAEALIALAAAHHRLLWIHPFGDGNGRVIRLATDAYLQRAGISGHGLWTSSRGLARNRKRYFEMLEAADAARMNDYDGRGNLSEKTLTQYCDFFLDICLDQIEYMHSVLNVNDLVRRVREYGEERERGRLPGMDGSKIKFRHEQTLLLENLVLRGSIPRADVPRLIHQEERTARRIVRSLTEEGFIESASTRTPLQFRVPAHAAPHFFPELYRSL